MTRVLTTTTLVQLPVINHISIRLKLVSKSWCIEVTIVNQRLDYTGRTSVCCFGSHNTLRIAPINIPPIIIGKVAIPPIQRKKLIGVTTAQFKQSLQSSLLKVGFLLQKSNSYFRPRPRKRSLSLQLL